MPSLGMRFGRAHGAPLALLVLVSVAAAAGCAGKNAAPVVYSDAGAQYRDGLAQIGERKLNRAKTTLRSIQYTSSDDRRELEPLVRMATADATFYVGNDLALIDARNLYVDFVTLYGDHPQAPYAQFQSGMCSLMQVVNPAKDQTQTFQAIDDFKEAERRYPVSRYAEAAELMRHVAESNLAEHCFEVGRFYFKRKKYLAAVDRFREVLERYPDYDRLDKVYFYIGRALLKSNNEVEARIYLDKLISDHPGGKLAPEAKKFLEQAGGALRTDPEGTP